MLKQWETQSEKKCKRTLLYKANSLDDKWNIRRDCVTKKSQYYN